MDSGPVAAFQVHEYLRPKVELSAPELRFKYQICCYLLFLLVTFYFEYSYSSVTCMKMIQSLISSSAV